MSSCPAAKRELGAGSAEGVGMRSEAEETAPVSSRRGRGQVHNSGDAVVARPRAEGNVT